MMTRTDFEDIANTLDANRASLDLVQDFADMCQEVNPRFDRAKFIDAATQNLRTAWATDQRILDRELNS